MSVSRPPTRSLAIVAKDPSVMVDDHVLMARIEVPSEKLSPGPRGSRIHVVDLDASTRKFYRRVEYPDGVEDPFARKKPADLLRDPGFHAQNCYAVAMSILARFELALGRRVSWGFRGHQLRIAPHAFADANAFYSNQDQALMFGYFPASDGTLVFTCLSHDV